MTTYLTHPIVLLTIGGAVGTNARYWLTVWTHEQRWTEHFPLATVLINVSGSLILGLLYVPFHNRLPGWWILLGVGFCGGYTTFSTFALETVNLIHRHHQPGMALLNVVVSVLISCGAVWIALLGMEEVIPQAHEPTVMEAEDPEIQKEP